MSLLDAVRRDFEAGMMAAAEAAILGDGPAAPDLWPQLTRAVASAAYVDRVRAYLDHHSDGARAVAILDGSPDVLADLLTRWGSLPAEDRRALTLISEAMAAVAPPPTGA